MSVVAPPGVEFMTDVVAHWAALQPDAEALTYGEVRWTWAQWDDRIRRVAGGLAALGLCPGSRVAFLDKNHPACLEVSLGAGLLGAVNAVINWRLAAGELDYVINDSGASVLFTGARVAARGAGHPGPAPACHRGDRGRRAGRRLRSEER